ncbi:MAG: nucleoside 2-deoxyribosyltransferase [Pseudomonadales bacterium]|nr:nucleoside 2-deoxyribosyltransferase [Pseudomonadales bacterium]
MKPTSFFIAGTMQGSRSGDHQIDQNYRQEIESIILRVFPGAKINCPGKIMVERLQDQEVAIRRSHATLVAQPTIDTSKLDDPMQRLTQIFHDLVDLSAGSDVCIAYLPNHEASMGTAAEMFAAYRNQKPVITVTEMKQNLAVLSCSTAIIPSLDFLSEALEKLSNKGEEKCA